MAHTQPRITALIKTDEIMSAAELFMENNLTGLFAFLLAGVLISLAWVDFLYLRLPNILNLLLALMGLAQSFILGYVHPGDALLGGAMGVCLLGSVAYGFRWLKGYDGLGMGDVKLAGAAGLWIGWQGVPLLVLVASLTALAAIAVHTLRGGQIERQQRLPFGPFLAAGTGCVWLGLIAAGINAGGVP
jgi:leader peptidase (prepilin peptidase)/N-methyltransferase